MKRSVVAVACKYAVLALLHNMFALDPSGGLQSVSSFTTQPITLKVPKDQVDGLKQAIQTNPAYLKQLIAQSGNSNGMAGPISFAPQEGNIKALSNLPSSPSSVSNAYPAFNQGPVTVALPQETAINGQKYYLTTRANMLYNKSANMLRNAASALVSPFSASTGCFNNVIGVNQMTPQQLVQPLKTVPKPTINTTAAVEEEDEDEEEEEIEEIEEVKHIRRPKTKIVTYTKQKRPGNGKRKKTIVKYESSEEENSGSSEGESDASGSDEGSGSGSGSGDDSGSGSVENKKQSPKKAKN